jgi:GNAT superfamily N-acetyltransferase
MHTQRSSRQSRTSTTHHHSIVVRRARNPSDWRAANELISEYMDWLDSSFGPVMVRMAGIGEADRRGTALTFNPPSQFYVAWLEGEPVGCAGVRVIGSDAELTRMFVKPGARGLGISERLVRWAIAGVRGAGFAYLRVATHTPTMPVAYGLYRRLGFEERRGGIDVDGAVQLVLPFGSHSRVP